MKKNIIIAAAILIVVAAGGLWFTRSGENEGDVQKEQANSESITIKGSDTLLQLVANLVEAFDAENPGSEISVAGGGSGTGIAALLNGEINLANSSRPIKEEERAQAVGLGLNIVEFAVARDGLSVVIHPDNPVANATIDQVGRLYRGEITNWREVGGNDAPVVLYGRQSTSGTYEFFREAVVQDDYALSMRNLEGNQAIVDAVKSDQNGIGYVGIGYVVGEDGQARDDIKVMGIAADDQSEFISPLDTAKVKARLYPLTRPLYQYLAATPKSGSLVDSFLRFEVSDKGGAVVKQVGFFEIFADDQANNQEIFEKINNSNE